MATLFDCIFKTAGFLKGLLYGQSTSAGSTTELVDTTREEANDYFNGGTIFFLSGSLIGKSVTIIDYSDTSHTFTFSAQSSAPGSGIRYAVLSSIYSRNALIAAVNEALSELSPIPMIYEDAAFITVADQESYTIPDGVFNIKKVFIATSETEPYTWQENNGWFENEGNLIFDMSIPAEDDMRIRLYYEGMHESVDSDEDEISTSIHPDIIAWSAAYKAALVRSGIAENTEPHTKEFIGFAAQQLQRMTVLHPSRHFMKTPRSNGWG